MNLELIKTVSLSDTKYVDLQRLNGELRTAVFQKVGQPNLFKEIENYAGDQFARIVKEQKK